MKPYLGKAHTLYLDNWYISPALFIFLYKNGTNTHRTVKERRKGTPITQKKLKMGEASFRSSSLLLAMKWCEKREVYMLRSFYNEKFVHTKCHYRTQEMIKKAERIVDYSRLMGTVDKANMVINTMHSERKSMKLYKNIFII